MNWFNKKDMIKFFYAIMSLPIKEVEIFNISKNDSSIVLSIKWITKKHRCPNCWSYNTKRVWTWFEIVKNIKHLFISSYNTIELDIYKKRFVCYDCSKKNKQNEKQERKYFNETFSFIDKSCHYTKTFKNYILKEWRYESIEELSRKFKVSNTFIYNLLSTVSINKLIEDNIDILNFLPEIYLWVDEVSFKGRDYFLHITEINIWKTIAVLKTNSSAELKKWLSKLPLKVLAKIKYIASDMNATYKDTIQSYIKEKLSAEIILWKVSSNVWEWVADLFHIKKLFNNLILEVYSLNNWMIKEWYYDNKHNDLTKKEIVKGNKYRKEPLGNDNGSDKKHCNSKNKIYIYSPKDTLDYKPITPGYFLQSNYHNLLWLSHDLLSKKQGHRLNQILFEFDPAWYMKEAYLWKELLNEALETKDVSLVQKIISDFTSSSHYKIQTLWNTLSKWFKEIKNYFETWITNALTEWKNTQIKLFKKMAFWYRIKENYMKRILLSL